MTPIAWPEAQRICDIPEVREALDKFAADAHDENMLAMVSAIMGAGSRPREWTDPVSLGSVNRDYDQGFADGCSESKRLNEHLVEASAQGRAAGLEEAYQAVRKIDLLVNQKTGECLSGGAVQSKAESAIRAISPTSSNAGKDDARDAQDEQDRETGRKWREDSSLETWFPFTAEELASAKKVFAAACADLGYISEELGLDPDDGGAEPILDAIRELKTDAARYRWLRDMNDWYAEPRIDEEDGTKWELVFYTTARIEDPTDDDTLDTAIDAALSSLEVIGKGEKG